MKRCKIDKTYSLIRFPKRIASMFFLKCFMLGKAHLKRYIKAKKNLKLVELFEMLYEWKSFDAISELLNIVVNVYHSSHFLILQQAFVILISL